MRSPKIHVPNVWLFGWTKAEFSRYKTTKYNITRIDKDRFKLVPPKLVRVNWGLNTIFRADAF